MRVIMLGPPGSGKGTQAAALTARLAIPAISTGNILRAEIAQGSEIGRKAEAFITTGQLVPDEVILDIMEHRLAQPDCKAGYVLDGFPRTVRQAESLEQKNIKIDVVLLMDVEDEVIVKRMTGRRVCPSCDATYHISTQPPAKDNMCDHCGESLVIRKDDAAETVLKRLNTYHENTEPLLAFYQQRGLLKRVENAPSIKETAENIMRLVGSVIL